MDEETINDLWREIDELRKLNNSQRDEINRLRVWQDEQLAMQHGDGGALAINNFIAGLRTLNTDTKDPKFEDDQRKNLSEFLASLETYFTSKRIPEAQKLPVAESSLEGRAKIWFEANRAIFDGYDAFRASFLA